MKHLLKNPVKLTIFFFGLLLLATLLTELLLMSQNNLANNGNWIVTKRMITMGLTGADEFLIDRSVLSGNKLNLAKYHGYHEVYTKRTYSFDQITFDFQIPQKSHLDFSIQLADGSSFGIRIRENSEHPPFYFVKDSYGVFREKKDLPETPLNKKNQFKLTFLPENLIFQINNNSTYKIDSASLSSEGRLTFASGPIGALLDNIKVKKNSKTIFIEDFRLKKSWFRIFSIHLLFLLTLTTVGSYLKFLLKKTPLAFYHSESQNYIIYQILTVILLFTLFDYFFYSSLSYRNETKLLFKNERPSVPFYEQARFSVFSYWANLLNASQDYRDYLRSNSYPINRIWKGPIYCSSTPNQCSTVDLQNIAIELNSNQCSNIVWLGTSQTVGAGATTLLNTFFAKTHEKLMKSKKIKCINSLNLAISGSNFGEVSKNYLSIQKKIITHILIINIANNDTYEGLKKSLNIFLKKNRVLVNILFIKEANDFNYVENTNLTLKHQLIDEVSKELSIRTIPLHSAINNFSKTEEGIIWWDKVHFTNYGQEIASDLITTEILNNFY